MSRRPRSQFGRFTTILRWSLAGFMAMAAIDAAVNSHWTRAASWSALSAGHVAMALGAEHDVRGRIFLWTMLVVAAALFASRWVGSH